MYKQCMLGLKCEWAKYNDGKVMCFWRVCVNKFYNSEYGKRVDKKLRAAKRAEKNTA